MLATALLLSSGGAAGFVAQPAGHLARASVPTPAAPLMNQRYDNPILNEDLPDPIFDVDSGYKGRVSFGFSEGAEKLNGRAAMMGFTFLFLQELFTGKGVLELYGLPYDAGALIQR